VRKSRLKPQKPEPRTAELPRPETLGGLLLAARERHSIPLEQAAHDTRIRVQLLRQIEADDLSHFSHPSYARMFLRDYAKYLGLPPSEVVDLLPERGECGAEGYQYLNAYSDTETEFDDRRLPRRFKRRRFLPFLGAVAAIFVSLLVAFQIYITIQKIDRLGLGSRSEADRAALDQAAAPVPTATPEAVASPSPVAVAAVSPENPDSAAVSDDEDEADEAIANEKAMQEAATAPSPVPAKGKFVIGGSLEHRNRLP